jgi:chromosomal replication initiator protein
MTFDSFRVSEGNRTAHSFAEHFAEHPGPCFPLFIHGGRGTGKTHLLMAIGNKIAIVSPKSNIVACDAAALLEEMSAKVPQESRDEFLLALKEADVLLLDNVNLLARRRRTQEDLMRVMEDLRARNRRVALTADQHPHDIPDLLRDFRSGLGGGLVGAVENRP